VVGQEGKTRRRWRLVLDPDGECGGGMGMDGTSPLEIRVDLFIYGIRIFW